MTDNPSATGRAQNREVRRPKTDVIPLSHVTNHQFCTHFEISCILCRPVPVNPLQWATGMRLRSGRERRGNVKWRRSLSADRLPYMCKLGIDGIMAGRCQPHRRVRYRHRRSAHDDCAAYTSRAAYGQMITACQRKRFSVRALSISSAPA